VFLAVGFIMFPIVTTATDSLLSWNSTVNASGNGSLQIINHTYFTGFDAVVGITPLLILIGYVSAAIFAMFLGVRIAKGGSGGTKLDLGALLMLGVSLIFIAIALIIIPVALEGIATVLHGGGQGINTEYTGLSQILRVTPLLILISFVAAAVVTGFFGIKKIGGG